MTWPVLFIVLFGALLHASWNALVKSSTDKTLDTALIHVLCSVFVLPVCLYVGPPPPDSWPYILGSLVVHVGYYFALAGAYKHGDLGLTYPLMRGTAPMLVAISSFAFIGETLSLLAWLGVACICGGVLLLGFTKAWWSHRKAILFALTNAVLIAIYTVIDAKGARSSGLVRARWPLASGGALASIGSYSIALWAMTVAPVAMVAALRETSVFFAALIGAWFLKEVWTRQRIAGTVAILSGVAALRLG